MRDKKEKSLEAEVALRQAAERLKAAGVESATLDARLLVQELFGFSHADILSGRAKPLNAAMQAQLEQATERRLRGESVHRILGHRAFYGLDLELSKDTLEPRPDTEALVELVLPFIKKKAAREGEGITSETSQVTLLDIGTGSGAIALALLAEVPQLRAVGADISAGALRTAQKNAERAGLSERFTACKSDCFKNIKEQFDFIVSNPPYIPRAEIETLAKTVRLYDPLRALDGGQDGLDFYRILAAGAQAHLKPDGMAAVEIGFNQTADVTKLFTDADFVLQAEQKDLGGLDRALLFAIR